MWTLANQDVLTRHHVESCSLGDSMSSGGTRSWWAHRCIEVCILHRKLEISAQILHIYAILSDWTQKIYPHITHSEQESLQDASYSIQRPRDYTECTTEPLCQKVCFYLVNKNWCSAGWGFIRYYSYHCVCVCVCVCVCDVAAVWTKLTSWVGPSLQLSMKIFLGMESWNILKFQAATMEPNTARCFCKWLN